MKKADLKLTAGVVAAAVYIAAFTLAAACCAGIGFAAASVAAVAVAAASLVCGNAFEGVPVISVFLLVSFMYAGRLYGETALLLTVLCFALLLVPLSRAPAKLVKLLTSPAAASGLMLALAFSATALLTTYYFGIGAQGDTVREILVPYSTVRQFA